MSGKLLNSDALDGKVKEKWGTATYKPFESKYKEPTKQLEPTIQYNLSK